MIFIFIWLASHKVQKEHTYDQLNRQMAPTKA